MLPHWSYNVHKTLCIDTINQISHLNWGFLLIKDHTRGSGGLSVDLKENLNKKENVATSINAFSPSLIDWSDVVINFGSSIGIEALLQGKHLVNPVYLHSNKTIIEDTAACHTVNNDQELINVLMKINDRLENSINNEAKDTLFREIIYGGKAPHDVIRDHWDYI
jgi:hypothetical protein